MEGDVETAGYRGNGNPPKWPIVLQLSFMHEFTLFSDLFLQMLHAQGDRRLSETLRTEYFQGIKRVGQDV